MSTNYRRLPPADAGKIQGVPVTETAPSNGEGLVYNSSTETYELNSTSFASHPASSTDHAVARYDGTSGDLQNSPVTISDAGVMAGVTELDVETLVATTTVTTGDNVIVLNDDVTGSPSQDAGIEVERGTSDNAQLLWDEDTDKWQAGTVGALADISLSGHTHTVTAVSLTNEPGSDHTGNGLSTTATAGETLAQNELVYMKAADGKVYKAKGDAATTVPAFGMITTGGSANDTVTILVHGLFRDDTWTWTAGDKLYVSAATGGALTATAPSASGNQVQIVGLALTDDCIFIRPDFTIVEVA